MTLYVPVPGTHGWPDDAHAWWRWHSPLACYLARRGLSVLAPDRPFVWSTDLDGLRFWRRWIGRGGTHRDWRAAGAALGFYLVCRDPQCPHGVPYDDRNLIAHSHGLQPVLYAAAASRAPFIRRLLSIGSPIRADMRTVIDGALPKIGRWLHVTTTGFDLMQILGRLGDGRIGAPALPRSVEVRRIPGIGHSDLLTDRAAFALWDRHGLIDFLRS